MDRRRANSGPYHKDVGQRAVEEHDLQHLSARNVMMMMKSSNWGTFAGSHGIATAGKIELK